VTRVLVNWAKALAAYEMTLTGAETPFDRFLREGQSSDAVGAAAKRGARLFVGKAGCVDCHDGPLLSDGGFHNVGVPQAGPEVPTEADCPAGAACDCTAGKNCLPWGALDGLAKLKASSMLRTSMWSDYPQDDSRATEVARAASEDLKGAWRTPSLRDVALTAPYMHDGRFATLAEVIDHYADGVLPHPNLDPRLRAPGAAGTPVTLDLSSDDRAALVAFLDTLTDDALVHDVRFSDPFR
jgi:cytochrome c peroxidase